MDENVRERVALLVFFHELACPVWTKHLEQQAAHPIHGHWGITEGSCRVSRGLLMYIATPWK